MKNIQLTALIAAIGAAAGSADAQTRWIRDTLSDQCAPASKSVVADATRRSIERSVARAEASIRAPASTADLSCMDDLMSVDLDTFSGDWRKLDGFDIEGLINDVVVGLESGLSVQTLSSGAQRAICGFAREKFEERTDAPTGSMDQIVSRLAPDLPAFGDGFGALNIPRGLALPRAVRPADAPPNPAPEAAGAGDRAGAPADRSRKPGGRADPIRSIWNAINGGAKR